MSGPIPLLALRDLKAPAAAARALLSELAPLVGGRASLASQDRLAASRDLWARAQIWSRAGYAGPLPDVVAWPLSVDEVVEVVRFAGRRSIPVVAYGGGTAGGGAVVPVRGGIALDLKRLSKVLSVDPEALEVECEAGILGEVLERHLAQHGLTTGHLGLDGRAATVGGWLATRSAGWAAGRYGKLEDMVASVTAVDGRGEVLTTARRPLAGFDVTRALLGSEGCLAILCSARLHLVRRPEAQLFAAWRFFSLRDGIEAVRAIVRAGLRPAVARLHDPLDTAAQEGEDRTPLGRRGSLGRRFDDVVSLPLRRFSARATTGLPRGLNAAARMLRSCLLVLGFEGPAELCELEVEEAARLCQTARAEDLGPEPARLWLDRHARAAFLESRAWDEGMLCDTIDLFATWDQALELHRQVCQALSPLAVVRARLTHAYSEGCAMAFSVTAAVDGAEEAGQRHEEIWRQALAAARSTGALASHGGGVGLQRINALEGQLGEGMRLLRALKATFDPHGILNPGKLGC